MWWRTFIIALACLLTGAHFLRYDNLLLTLGCALLPLLCFGPKPALRLLQLALLSMLILVWGMSTFDYVQLRMAAGVPWMRLLLIMGAVMTYMSLALWASFGLDNLRPQEAND
ncbi:hypothetical protein [Shewanella sedimentimangrovi]|uniref:Uncharacterized protein n=1 Tax=Shewanella sedimentimangrovi TaxID=2814293 RepID=A0ABX7QZ18_9GAMM|nr:hypothetical protein [Shewanella sedimentimangrovi]QSX35856.1 hypothetical protein JYB85_10810 [Shewanella sedimentimangrovi]